MRAKFFPEKKYKRRSGGRMAYYECRCIWTSDGKPHKCCDKKLYISFMDGQTGDGEDKIIIIGDVVGWASEWRDILAPLLELEGK